MKKFAVAIITSAIFLGVWQTRKNAQAPGSDRREYRRVVALAPNFCEVMTALQLDHRLVGITSHCEDPNLAQVKKVGSFAEVNFEAIVALNPDLVLAVPHAMAMSTISLLREIGIEVYDFQPDSIEHIKQINLDLGQKFNVLERASAINHEIDQALYDARQLTSSLNRLNNDNYALIAVASSPLVVAGPLTFSAQVAHTIGLKNMANSSMAAWPMWPLEKLLSHPPNLFIVAEGRAHWPRYQKLSATLGIDEKKTTMKFIIPARPIFTSPSPLLIKDIKYFSELLISSI